MPCAPGTVFNPGIGVCDHPWNVTGCGRTTEPPTPTTTAPPPPPFDCKQVNVLIKLTEKTILMEFNLNRELQGFQIFDLAVAK